MELYYPSYRRAVQAAAQEARWVCWYYDVQEWQLLAVGLRESSQRRLGGVLLRGILFILLIAGGSTGVMWNQARPGWLELTFVVTAVGCAMAFVSIIVGQVNSRNQTAQYALQQDSHQICIGPLAVFLPGETLALGGYSAQGPTIGSTGIDVLQAVAVLDGIPTQVVFSGRQLAGRGALGARIRIEIPIPAGHETEAAQLVQRFHTTILNGD